MVVVGGQSHQELGAAVGLLYQRRLAPFTDEHWVQIACPSVHLCPGRGGGGGGWNLWLGAMKVGVAHGGAAAGSSTGPKQDAQSSLDRSKTRREREGSLRSRLRAPCDVAVFPTLLHVVERLEDASGGCCGAHVDGAQLCGDARAPLIVPRGLMPVDEERKWWELL